MNQTPTVLDRRLTKIVVPADATIDEATVNALIGAGMNALHLDLARDDLAAVGATYKVVRAAAHEARTPISILVGLAGAPSEQAHQAAIAAELGADYVVVPGVVEPSGLHAVTAGLAGAGPGVLAALAPTDAPLDVGAIVEASDGVVVPPDIDPELAVVVYDDAVGSLRPCIASWAAGNATALAGESTPAFDAVLLAPGLDADGCLAELAEVDRTLRARERAAAASRNLAAHAFDAHESVRDALQQADDLGARAIIVLPADDSGELTRALAAARTHLPIVGCETTLPGMLRLGVVRGVVPRWIRPDELGDMDALARGMIPQLRLAGPGDRVVCVDDASISVVAL